MSSLLRDLRHATRTLRQSPGFTIVAVLTLAVGIGANTAIFSFLDALLLKPLPYEGADRIVRVMEKPPRFDRNVISTLNFLDWQKDNTVFDFLSAQTGDAVTLTGGTEPVQLRAGRVSADYFKVFQIQPAFGRTFLAGEDQLGKHQVAVISYAFWASQFGSDPSIVNRTVLLNNEPHTIVGVLPRGSAFDRAVPQVWRPLAFEPTNMTRDFHWLVSFARLKDGVTLEQARAEMDAIGKRIERDFPDSNKGWGVVVERYGDILVGPENRTIVLLMISATGFVLLIGCANLANLALARGVSREREVIVRASLGAGRWDLIRQFLTENVLLSVCGGLLGLVIGYALMNAIQLMLPPFAFAREVEVTMDARVLLFAAVVSILTGLLFGMAPALQATKPDLAASMKEEGRGSSGSVGRRRLRDSLIVAEVALAFVLLVVSGLMMRSFMGLLNVDAGFDSTNLLTMRLPADVKQYPDPEQLNRYLREVKAAVEAVPGVRETAYSCAPPMQGTCYGMPMQVADRPRVDVANRDGGFYKVVSPSYFSTLGIKPLKGRLLSDRDTSNSPPALVMNERLAKRFFPNEDPVGKHILIQQIIPGQTGLGPDISWEVVGVLGDEKIGGPTDVQSAGVYVSNEQSPVYGLVMTVRGSVNPMTLQAPITAAIRGVNKDQAISDIRTVEQIRDQSMGGRRLVAVLLGTFGTVALVLAGLGIYGVISYNVAQRTREIGIRAALGATQRSLLRLILDRGIRLTLIGLAIGAAGAIGLTRLLASLLFGVGARDPVTMVSVGVILAAVAVIASYVPARRAMRVDPVVALRYE
ncbi:MAG TPA: ABC transporter permease [Vicinamibacterales bacterium]|nr:ABC transporter permease [Vicinamibacterales bacterium]